MCSRSRAHLKLTSSSLACENLTSRLPIMAGFGEGLMVVGVPEEVLVTAMRHDVIDHNSRKNALEATALITLTQRSRTQELQPVLAPTSIIPSLCRCAAPLVEVEGIGGLEAMRLAAAPRHQR